MTAPVDRSTAEGLMTPRARIRIPLWRRITAIFSLAFMSVLGGVVMAGVLGGTALLLLFLLERAIAT
jgi:hypothetical protein